MEVKSEGARSIWEEYRLLGEQFRGPATVAWTAEHLISGRRARLTTVHAPPMASGVTAEAISHAFRRAAERARDFTHPDHLPIIGIAEQSGLPVTVTMLTEGAAFSERLSEAWSLGDAMKQVSQVAHVVAALHAAGLRHGYVIPENLWVRVDGRLALIDAGLHGAAAQAAAASGFPVTPSPYIAASEDAYADANQAADVYSLAALLVRLITGRLVPPEHLPQAIDALPAELPDSLRTELRDVVIQSGSTAPTARSLAVHLAFDTAWIRARERTQREQDVVEGEVLDRENAPLPGEDALARWARAYPSAGVRGGAAGGDGPAAPLATVPAAMARLAGAGRSALEALRSRLKG